MIGKTYCINFDSTQIKASIMSECKGSAPASGRNKSVIKNPDEAGDSPVLLLN